MLILPSIQIHGFWWYSIFSPKLQKFEKNQFQKYEIEKICPKMDLRDQYTHFWARDFALCRRGRVV